MKQRLALGALIAVVLALVGAWPAHAAYPPVLTALDNPDEGAVWNGADALDFHIKGRAETDAGNNVTRVRAIAEQEGTSRKFEKEQRWGDSSNVRNFDFTNEPPYNGKYKIHVSAWGISCNILGCGGEQQGATTTRSVTVLVPPAIPTGVDASEKDGTATVSWNGNNDEPDLLGYIVERQQGTSAFKCVDTVTIDTSKPRPEKFSVTDDLDDLPNGDYRWRIKAVRASDPASKMSTCTKNNGGINSVPSDTALVKWRSSTVTTTTSTTTPGGGGGGGGTTTTKPKTGAGGGAGTAGPSRRPNLSALGSLGNNLASTPSRRVTPPEVDSGFNELLPFQSQGDDPEVGSALPESPIETEEDGNGGVTTLLFIAAGLLATVLSMHVLWLKAQVDRMPLESLAPEDVALS